MKIFIERKCGKVKDLKPIIAKNISALRQSVGMTQLELSEKLHYSDKAVSKWERGESIPDVIVLKEIADIFGVTLDHLVQSEHSAPPKPSSIPPEQKARNHGFIVGISIMLVWLVAAFVYFIIDTAFKNSFSPWLCFVYAVPVSMIVWLIFNSAWFNSRRNFLIISLLVWSFLAAVYLNLLTSGHNLWKIFIFGVIGQIIIVLWSRLSYRSKGQPTASETTDRK